MVHFCLFSNSTRLLAATTLRNVLGILRTVDYRVTDYQQADAINIFRSNNDHYIPLLLHAEGTKDLAEILSERESIAHTMQVYFCIVLRSSVF